MESIHNYLRGWWMGCKWEFFLLWAPLCYMTASFEISPCECPVNLYMLFIYNYFSSPLPPYPKILFTLISNNPNLCSRRTISILSVCLLHDIGTYFVSPASWHCSQWSVECFPTIKTVQFRFSFGSFLFLHLLLFTATIFYTELKLVTQPVL